MVIKYSWRQGLGNLADVHDFAAPYGRPNIDQSSTATKETTMFPHPHNMLNIRAMEREQTIAAIERQHRFAPGLPRRDRAPKVSFLRRAARAVAMLVG